jgi:hypothetical protein
MAIEFGLNRLRAYTNGIGSGVTVDGGTGSATVESGSVWIGGKECIVSSSSMDIATAADTNTGVMFIYAYLPATNSSTANVTFATGSSPIALGYPNIDTAIAVISQGAFGTATSSYTTAANASTSGLTGMRAFGRSQNATINITYDNALARGGTLIFANDQKLFNGSIEGTLEYANISGANLAKIYGGSWASGGAGSGTMTLTATNEPIPFMIEARQVTNGVTATYRLLKCYSNSITLNLDRENYLIPSLNFVAIANHSGEIMTMQV